jgi:hypothetical protein
MYKYILYIYLDSHRIMVTVMTHFDTILFAGHGSRAV